MRRPNNIASNHKAEDKDWFDSYEVYRINRFYSPNTPISFDFADSTGNNYIDIDYIVNFSSGIANTKRYFRLDDVAITYDHFQTFNHMKADSSGYRFGFNGKEKDNEIYGNGCEYDYGFRIYDPRLGRFLSVDPLTKDFSGWSPYTYAMNRPIDGIDMDGLEYLRYDKAAPFGWFSAEVMTANEIPAVVYNRFVFFNIGGHVYRDENGNYSTTPCSGCEKVSEWIYSEISPVIPNSTHASYNEYGDCYVAATKTLKNAGYEAKTYWAPDNQYLYQMFTVSGTPNVDIAKSRQAGLDAIQKSLEAGKPVLVGVDYHESASNNETDATTDHFVVIVGRGSDIGGEYFTFFENVDGGDSSRGTDITLNKLYIQSDGTLKGSGVFKDGMQVTQVRTVDTTR